MSVVALLPNNALCVNASDLAARLRDMADRVEGGEFGEVERVIVVLDAPAVDYRCYGRPTDKATLIGLLEYAKAKAMGFIE
mgnify:CR=1 FL=1